MKLVVVEFAGIELVVHLHELTHDGKPDLISVRACHIDADRRIRGIDLLLRATMLERIREAFGVFLRAAHHTYVKRWTL